MSDEEVYQTYYQEALREPMPWFPLDSDFMRDVKVRRLALYGGWAYIGMWAAFMACLAGIADGHIYDVSDDFGWDCLRSDMAVVGCELSDDDLREFIGVLLKLELLDNSMYDESTKLCSDRMMRNAENYADRRAGGKAKTYKARKAKAAGK